MVPRPDMIALRDRHCPITDLLATMLDHPYTRYPVYEVRFRRHRGGAARPRPVLWPCTTAGSSGSTCGSVLRPAIVVPETEPLDELLASSVATSTHMAVVADEYGSVAGLATLEDLLEEIVGEIDDGSTCPTAGIRRLGRSKVRLGGSFPIEDFNDRFGTELDDDDDHSVGGWVFGELGRAPKVGDSVTHGRRLRFEVSAVDGPRITEVDVDLTQAEREPAPAEESS